MTVPKAQRKMRPRGRGWCREKQREVAGRRWYREDVKGYVVASKIAD